MVNAFTPSSVSVIQLFFGHGSSQEVPVFCAIRFNADSKLPSYTKESINTLLICEELKPLIVAWFALAPVCAAFAATGAPVDHVLAELKAAARSLKQQTELNLLPTLSRLEHSNRCPAGRLLL